MTHKKVQTSVDATINRQFSWNKNWLSAIYTKTKSYYQSEQKHHYQNITHYVLNMQCQPTGWTTGFNNTREKYLECQYLWYFGQNAPAMSAYISSNICYLSNLQLVLQTDLCQLARLPSEIQNFNEYFNSYTSNCIIRISTE